MGPQRNEVNYVGDVLQYILPRSVLQFNESKCAAKLLGADTDDMDMHKFPLTALFAPVTRRPPSHPLNGHDKHVSLVAQDHKLVRSRQLTDPTGPVSNLGERLRPDRVQQGRKGAEGPRNAPQDQHMQRRRRQKAGDGFSARSIPKAEEPRHDPGDFDPSYSRALLSRGSEEGNEEFEVSRGALDVVADDAGEQVQDGEGDGDDLIRHAHYSLVACHGVQQMRLSRDSYEPRCEIDELDNHAHFLTESQGLTYAAGLHRKWKNVGLQEPLTQRGTTRMSNKQALHSIQSAPQVFQAQLPPIHLDRSCMKQEKEGDEDYLANHAAMIIAIWGRYERAISCPFSIPLAAARLVALFLSL